MKDQREKSLQTNNRNKTQKRTAPKSEGGEYMYIYDQASSLQRKSSLYKISELKLKRATDRGLPLGSGGVFVEKQPVKVIHSDPASRIGKSRRAVADRPLQATLVKCISLYLMSPSSLTERGTSGVHMPFREVVYTFQMSFLLRKKLLHFQSITKWQGAMNSTAPK